MNVELLNKIKQEILNEPESFQMAAYLKTPVKGNIKDYGLEWQTRCGTACCIAGHAISLSKETQSNDETAQAVRLLSLNSDQARRLFFLSNWPYHLREKFLAAGSVSERAKVAAERIDLMISTGE